jgi:hypothetical protein
MAMFPPYSGPYLGNLALTGEASETAYLYSRILQQAIGPPRIGVPENPEPP